MTERERLIELLRETFEYTREVCIDFDEAVEINADHLLSNGVIVPPCKVGDKVYKILGNSIVEMKVSMIEMGKAEVLHLETPSTFYYCFDRAAFADIGETVFLTKKEAEARLKERSEGK